MTKSQQLLKRIEESTATMYAIIFDELSRSSDYNQELREKLKELGVDEPLTSIDKLRKHISIGKISELVDWVARQNNKVTL